MFENEIMINLEEVERFIREELAAILLENTSFENAAFVLQAAINLLEEAQNTIEED